MTMLSNDHETTTRPDSAARSTSRRVIGVARIIAGLLVVAGIVTEITDTIAHDTFRPDQYFAYFTIESSMMNVVVLVVGGILALKVSVDTRLFTNVRMAILSYAIVTAIVYNALLRNIPSGGGYQAPDWPTELFHVAIPILLVIDWLFTPGRIPVRWTSLWLVVSYPVGWLAFTMIRGGFSGYYPYPFLVPTGSGGVPSVVVYCLLISVVIVGFACAAIAISRSTRNSSDRA